MRKYLLLFILLLALSGCQSNLLGADNTKEWEKAGNEKLKLKASKDKILFSQKVKEIICLERVSDDSNSPCKISTTTEIIKYRYVSDIKVPEHKFTGKIKNQQKKESELLGASDEIFVTGLPETEIDYNRIDYQYTPTTTISELFGGVQFVKNVLTGEWFYFEVATTTEEAFEGQTSTTTVSAMFYPNVFTINSVYAATDTYYPDANVETNTFDGRACAEGKNESWTLLSAEPGNVARDSDTVEGSIILWSTATNNNWQWSCVGIFLFDTASLPDTDTIDSAVLSIYGYGKADGLSVNPNSVIVSINPSSNTSATGADFSTRGSIDYSNRITYSSYSTTGYNDYTFNSSGINSISKTSISKYSMANGQYLIDAVSPTWSNNVGSYFQVYYADYAGTTNDPKLVIVHSASSGGVTPPTANIINFE